MLVRSVMTANPVTVTEDASIVECLEIIRHEDFSRLPVVREDTLVGIVTELDLLRVSPSDATSLSVFEMNYILSNMRVRDVMSKNPVFVSPDCTIEDAALLMQEKSISGLPVVENGRLIGIISEIDLFRALTHVMGAKEGGLRVTIPVEDRPGVLAEVTGIISSMDIDIFSVVAYDEHLIFRLCTSDAERVVRELAINGYEVSHQAIR